MEIPKFKNARKIKSKIIEYANMFPIFCYGWDSTLSMVVTYLQRKDYAQQILSLSQSGLVRRFEVYSDQTLKINDQTYYVRMQSYGHFKKERMLAGINEMAHAFDKVLIDYVFLFLEEKDKADEKLTFKIQKAFSREQYRKGLQFIDYYERILEIKSREVTEIKQKCLAALSQINPLPKQVSAPAAETPLVSTTSTQQLVQAQPAPEETSTQQNLIAKQNQISIRNLINQSEQEKGNQVQNKVQKKFKSSN